MTSSDVRETLRAELWREVALFPRACLDGCSWNVAVDFKNTLAGARKVASRRNASETALRDALASLGAFR